MPRQKAIVAQAENPKDIALVFGLAQDLREDGWGVTLVANPYTLALRTNAPSNIIDFHFTKRTHALV